MAYALAEPEIDFALPDGWRMVGFPKRVLAFGINHGWRVTYTKVVLPDEDGKRKKAPVLIITIGVHSGQLLDWRYMP